MSSRIKGIRAREVLDSRGNPTVEADVMIDKGIARAIAPSGASTGKYEAVELRDAGKRYLGKGVLKAVDNINKIISKKIIGKDCARQQEIDKIMLELDGTENKSKLGANAILAVSIAVCKAGASSKKIPLYKHISDIFGNKNKSFAIPVPILNVINGGKHAGNDLSIQEFQIIPVGASSFSQALQISSETYQTLKEIIKKRYGRYAINVGDEGGFAPSLSGTEEALELITKAIEQAGYKNRIKIGLDCAASEFYESYNYKIDKTYMPYEKLSGFYENLIKKYDIISIEDPFYEDNFEEFSFFKKNNKIQIIGDDLLVTNVNRIKKAIESNSCNALLLKINQIGTISESFEAAKLSMKSKWNVIVSHRSGDTEDSFISDFAVGISAGMIKAGAPCRSERTAKYNQLLRIEEELGKKAKYAKFSV